MTKSFSFLDYLKMSFFGSLEWFPPCLINFPAHIPCWTVKKEALGGNTNQRLAPCISVFIACPAEEKRDRGNKSNNRPAWILPTFWNSRKRSFFPTPTMKVRRSTGALGSQHELGQHHVKVLQDSRRRQHGGQLRLLLQHRSVKHFMQNEKKEW